MGEESLAGQKRYQGPFRAKAQQDSLPVPLDFCHVPQDMDARDQPIRLRGTISLRKVRISSPPHNSMDCQSFGIGGDKGHHLTQSRSVSPQGRQGNHIVVPYKRRHAETLGSKTKQRPFLQYSFEKLRKPPEA